MTKILRTLTTLMTFALMLALMPLIFAQIEADNDSNNNATDLGAVCLGTLDSAGNCIISNASEFNTVPILSEDNSSAIEEELEMNETVTTGTILGQQIKIWFTLNKERKMEAELKLARLRLIQANIAAKNNNTQAMEKALEAHERIINRVQEGIKDLDGENNVTSLNYTAVKLISLQRAIEVHERRVEYIQEKLTNSNLTQNQIEKIEARLEKAQNSTAHLIQVSEDKKDEIKNRLMNRANLTEEEAENIVEDRINRVEERIEERLERRRAE